MKYSIVMPYYHRPEQLHNTLLSYLHHYWHRSDFEILIVEDPKNRKEEKYHTAFLDVVNEFKEHLPLDIINCSIRTINPGPLYNYVVGQSIGEFLVLTSPECFHLTNVLSGLDEEFAKNRATYIVCACREIEQIGRRLADFNKLTFKPISWYQHSVERDVKYHFCSALAYDYFVKIGGFDEDFASGLCFDDDDFRDRIALLLNVKCRDDLVVLHQAHERVFGRYRDFKALVKRNQDLYNQKRKERANEV